MPKEVPHLGQRDPPLNQPRRMFMTEVVPAKILDCGALQCAPPGGLETPYWFTHLIAEDGCLSRLPLTVNVQAQEIQPTL